MMFPRTRDGIYPRCVWCGKEVYALAVTAYSHGEQPCLHCNNFVPESYMGEIPYVGGKPSVERRYQAKQFEDTDNMPNDPDQAGWDEQHKAKEDK